MESPNNWGFVCPKHRPKHDPIWDGMPLADFMDRFCKLAFPCPNGDKEYMWVKVTGLAETEGEELGGTLNNDPIKATDFQNGDRIEFSRSEILGLM